MTRVQLELPPELMREATANAIVGRLTPEVKTALIEKAVQALLTPDRYAGTNAKSPLEEAFERAVRSVVQDICREIVANDPTIRARLQAMVADVAKRFTEGKMDRVMEKFEQAFWQGLSEKY